MPHDDDLPPAGVRRARGDELGARGERGESLRPRRAREEGAQALGELAGLLEALVAREGHDAAPELGDDARRVALERLAHARRDVPVAGVARGGRARGRAAAHLGEHAGRRTGRGDDGEPAGALAQREGVVGASTAAWAWCREANGPMCAAGARTSRTSERRGYASSVSRTHVMRSGCRDRRLYRGACSAMRRSSRTCASSGVAHTTGVTACAMRTISVMRPRFSERVKYDRTRRRIDVDVPT